MSFETAPVLTAFLEAMKEDVLGLLRRSGGTSNVDIKIKSRYTIRYKEHQVPGYSNCCPRHIMYKDNHKAEEGISIENKN